MSDSIVIATRESPLALWQAEHVQVLLAKRYPEKDVHLLGITTKGDRILDKTLSKIGGKGLFVKELEMAMQEGAAHLAVHSLKDVPMELPEGFVLAAVSSREDPRDRIGIRGIGCHAVHRVSGDDDEFAPSDQLRGKRDRLLVDLSDAIRSVRHLSVSPRSGLFPRFSATHRAVAMDE